MYKKLSLAFTELKELFKNKLSELNDRVVSVFPFSCSKSKMDDMTTTIAITAAEVEAIVQKVVISIYGIKRIV